jgi:hypothetical protein
MRRRTQQSPAVASRGRQTAVDDGEAERDPAAADKVPVGQAQAPALAAKLRRGDAAERGGEPHMGGGHRRSCRDIRKSQQSSNGDSDEKE